MMRYLSPPTLAELWGVSADKVLSLIRNGELDAINLAQDARGKRPRYRISEQAIRAFELRRSVAKPAPAGRRERRSKRDATVVEWF